MKIISSGLAVALCMATAGASFAADLGYPGPADEAPEADYGYAPPPQVPLVRSRPAYAPVYAAPVYAAPVYVPPPVVYVAPPPAIIVGAPIYYGPRPFVYGAPVVYGAQPFYGPYGRANGPGWRRW